jgi:hypothetical protein
VELTGIEPAAAFGVVRLRCETCTPGGGRSSVSILPRAPRSACSRARLVGSAVLGASYFRPPGPLRDALSATGEAAAVFATVKRGAGRARERAASPKQARPVTPVR